MSTEQQVRCLCCGIRPTEFTDKEIDRMRSFLAKQWKQTVDQVTEYEALDQLRRERST